MKYFGYEEGSNFIYWTYASGTVYSSDGPQKAPKSYTEEYKWFTEVCEECDVEPECYED